MNDTARQDQIRVAARWWREALADTAMQDDGVRGVGAIGGTLLRQGAQTELSEERLDAFEATLVEFLRLIASGAAVDLTPDYTAEWVGGFSLNVDYDPDLLLGLIAERVGIPEQAFPWKNRMRLEEFQTVARRGYDGEWIVIWATGSITSQVASER